MTEKERARKRRARTHAVGDARRLMYTNVMDLDRRQYSPHIFAKDHPLGCNCRKRLKGRPRLSTFCNAGSRDRIYTQRKLKHQLDRMLRDGLDPYDDRVL